MIRPPIAWRVSWRTRAIVLLAGLAGSLCGCFSNQCDPTPVKTLEVGSWRLSGCAPETPCTMTWTSSATLDPWVAFPAAARLTFSFPPLPVLPAGLQPDFPSAVPSFWVASAPPSDPNPNFTEASGQLAEATGLSSTSLSVFNASCQSMFLLAQVTVPVDTASDAGL